MSRKNNIDDIDYTVLADVLMDAGLLGPDRSVSLDLEGSKHCPFCNFHLQEIDLLAMSKHMMNNHAEKVSDEAVEAQLKRIRNEQDGFLS